MSGLPRLGHTLRQRAPQDNSRPIERICRTLMSCSTHIRGQVVFISNPFRTMCGISEYDDLVNSFDEVPKGNCTSDSQIKDVLLLPKNRNRIRSFDIKVYEGIKGNRGPLTYHQLPNLLAVQYRINRRQGR